MDQVTGEDLNPSHRQDLTHVSPDDLAARNPDRPANFPRTDTETGRRRWQRLSSLEKWEQTQLAAASVLDKTQLAGMVMETGGEQQEEDSGWCMIEATLV